MANKALKIPARSVFAAIVLNAQQHPPSQLRADWPTLGDLTQRIIELKRKHQLDTSGISIRADKGGWISDDLSSFVNRFVLFGLASQSPVRLTPMAVQRCVKIVQKDRENQQDEIDRLINLLGLAPLFTEQSSHPGVATGSLV